MGRVIDWLLGFYCGAMSVVTIACLVLAYFAEPRGWWPKEESGE